MDRKTEMLLICGALAGPLFTLAWIVGGSLKLDYDPMRHAISSLAVGEFGWLQDTSLVLTGILSLALAWGLWTVLRSRGGSLWAPICLVVVGVGFVGGGLFTTDPLNGYPPGTPPLPIPPTLQGGLHLLFSALVFGLPAAAFVLARQFDRQGKRGWAVYSRLTAVTFIILYFITIAAFLQVDGLVSYAGLLQRISLTIILTWMTLLPTHLLKSLRKSTAMIKS